MIKQKSFFVFQSVLGSLFLFYGILALFQQTETYSFLPSELVSSSLLEVVILFMGLFFLREAVRNKDSGQRIAHFVVGLLLFFVSAFPLFVTLGFLKSFPYYIDLSVSPFLLCLLVLFSAGYMILDRIFLFIS